MVKVIKRINTYFFTVIFAGISCLALFISLFLCFPAISGEFTIFGNKVVFVATDRVSNTIAPNTFIGYSEDISNVKVGDFILFEYNSCDYIQHVDEIQFDGNVVTGFKTSDNTDSLIVNCEQVYGQYMQSYNLFSTICVAVKDWYPIVMYIGIPLMTVVGLMLGTLQIIENRKLAQKQAEKSKEKEILLNSMKKENAKVKTESKDIIATKAIMLEEENLGIIRPKVEKKSSVSDKIPLPSLEIAPKVKEKVKKVTSLTGTDSAKKKVDASKIPLPSLEIAPKVKEKVKKVTSLTGTSSVSKKVDASKIPLPSLEIPSVIKDDVEKAIPLKDRKPASKKVDLSEIAPPNVVPAPKKKTVAKKTALPKEKITTSKKTKTSTSDSLKTKEKNNHLVSTLQTEKKAERKKQL